MTQRRKYTPMNETLNKEAPVADPEVTGAGETTCNEVVEEFVEEFVEEVVEEAVKEAVEPVVEKPEPEPEPASKGPKPAYIRPAYSALSPETSKHPRNTPRYTK